MGLIMGRFDGRDEAWQGGFNVEIDGGSGLNIFAFFVVGMLLMIVFIVGIGVGGIASREAMNETILENGRFVLDSVGGVCYVKVEVEN